MALECSSVQQLCCRLGIPAATCNEPRSRSFKSGNKIRAREAWSICYYPSVKLGYGVPRSTLIKPSNVFSVCWAVEGTATESSLTCASVEETPLTFYEILGISQGVSDDDIKDAYRSLAKKYHPDRAPLEKAEEYQKKFLEVNKAYSILKDPRRRTLYDFEIRNSFTYQSNWRFQPRNRQWRGCNWETDQCWTC